MVYMQWIITISSVIAAIIAIWRIVVFFVHLSDEIKKTNEYVSKNIDNVEDIKEIRRHTTENYMSILRLTIMNESMPITERVIAGDKYIAEGGNGEVKHYIETHFRPNYTERDWEVHNGKKEN